jgi:hypothetical protein
VAKITINEGLGWMQTLKQRHAELVGLRNQNANKETRYYGAHADKEVTKDPVYDVKKLDALVTKVAMEIRKVDMAIKKANATTELDYNQDDSVLGQVE